MILDSRTLQSTQDRAQVEKLAEAVQEVTGENIELAPRQDAGSASLSRLRHPHAR
jgi:hypothetical protein